MALRQGGMVYPPESEAAGEEGKVMLNLTIDEEGKVSDAAVVKSSGFERLDQAARDAVLKHWRFRPARKDGKAVPSQALAPINWKLSGPTPEK